MPKKALTLFGLTLLIIGAAAYWQFYSATTSDVDINSYLKGEMAKLSLPDPVPDLSARIIMQEDGSPISFRELRGKVLLVNLWAPWCAPCRAEMKELANLQRELGDDKFEVVAINVNRGGIPEARETLKEWGVEGLPLYAEPTMAIAFELAEGKLPTSYVIDLEGKTVGFYLGPLKWDKPEAIAYFSALKRGETIN